MRDRRRGEGTPPYAKKQLLVLGLELLQELHQSLSALDGHSVIHAGAEAAHGLVTLEVIIAGSLGGGDDFGVQLGGPEDLSSSIWALPKDLRCST